MWAVDLFYWVYRDSSVFNGYFTEASTASLSQGSRLSPIYGLGQIVIGVILKCLCTILRLFMWTKSGKV